MEFTNTGLKVDSEADVFNSMAEDAQIKLSPYLNGSKLKTDSSSLFGRTFHIVAKPISENQQIAQSIIKQIDISQAEGLQLDYLAYCTARMTRNLASLAVGEVAVNGNSGVTLPKNSYVANSVTGDIFVTQDDVEFNLNNVSGLTFRIDTKSTNYTIRFSITGLISQNPTISIGNVDTSGSFYDVAERIANSVNTQTSLITATVNNDATVTLKLVGHYHSDFYLPDELSLVNCDKLVGIKADSYTSSSAKAGVITLKKTSLDGFNSVTNPFAIPASKAVEKDSEFQRRLSYGKGKIVGSWDAIVASLYSVSGVSFVNVKSSNTQLDNGDVIPTGLAITVLGGDEDEIGVALFNSVSAGIATQGNIIKSVNDINGNSHEYRFSRPERVDVKIILSITEYNNFPTNGKQLIKQYLVDYFNSLSVGEPVQYSRLYTPINYVDGFSISEFTIGKLGEGQSASNIQIAHNQIASLSADNILIGGV